MRVGAMGLFQGCMVKTTPWEARMTAAKSPSGCSVKSPAQGASQQGSAIRSRWPEVERTPSLPKCNPAKLPRAPPVKFW